LQTNKQKSSIVADRDKYCRGKSSLARGVVFSGCLAIKSAVEKGILEASESSINQLLKNLSGESLTGDEDKYMMYAGFYFYKNNTLKHQ
jgi:hypothetical protein